MARPRPCLVCSQVFTPHPRAGDRQKTCSAPECQRERHRRNCADWHQRNEGYDRARRATAQLAAARKKARQARQGSRSRNPVSEIPWDVVRDSVGLEAQRVLREIGQFLVEWVRDAVSQEVEALREQLAEIGPGGARDAFAARGSPA